MDYDDYDDYDDGFGDYDDAADDWEAEADQLEEEEQAKAAEKQARLEKKLATRAPVKKAEEEAAETLVPEDVQKEVERLSQEAAGMDDSLLQGGTVQIIADLPADTPENATVVGQAIADRLLQFSDKPNFDEMMNVFLKEVAGEFKSVTVLNDEISKAHVATEELKRMKKANGNRRVVTKTSNTTGDALDFAQVEDRGGAEVPEDYESPW